MQDFRVLLKLGEMELGFFHKAETRGIAWEEVEEMHPGAKIEFVIPVKEAQ